MSGNFYGLIILSHAVELRCPFETSSMESGSGLDVIARGIYFVSVWNRTPIQPIDKMPYGLYYPGS
jgi:hypothetical protein